MIEKEEDYYSIVKPMIRERLRKTPYAPINDIIYSILWMMPKQIYAEYLTAEKFNLMIYRLREYGKRKTKKYVK